MFTGGKWATTPLFRREELAPGQKVDGPAIIAEANATTVVEPGWSATVTKLDHLVLERVVPREKRVALGYPGRPGDARDLQQPLHVDRRADGPAAAEHRLLREHQGAARLLLRAVRRSRQPDRQRAAHAGAPGLDGRIDQDRDPRERRKDEAGQRLRAERALQRRHAPARRHRDHAGVRRKGQGNPVLRRLARPPRRHRRHHAGLDAARLEDGGRGRAC